MAFWAALFNLLTALFKNVFIDRTALVAIVLIVVIFFIIYYYLYRVHYENKLKNLKTKHGMDILETDQIEIISDLEEVFERKIKELTEKDVPEDNICFSKCGDLKHVKERNIERYREITKNIFMKVQAIVRRMLNEDVILEPGTLEFNENVLKKFNSYYASIKIMYKEKLDNNFFLLEWSDGLGVGKENKTRYLNSFSEMFASVKRYEDRYRKKYRIK